MTFYEYIYTIYEYLYTNSMNDVLVVSSTKVIKPCILVLSMPESASLKFIIESKQLYSQDAASLPCWAQPVAQSMIY